MKTPILTLLSLLLFANAFAQAATERTITLLTAEPRCEIRLIENSNATVGGPGNQTFVLAPQEFKSSISYEHSYAYSLLVPPTKRGGIEISLSTDEEESDWTFQVRHAYPHFPSSIQGMPDNLPEGPKALVVLRMPKKANGKIGPISQTIFLDSMVRFEKIFGVPYISVIDVSCK